MTTDQIERQVQDADQQRLGAGGAVSSVAQALVRLPMLQRVRDARAGHRTAGLIAGYRGASCRAHEALWQAKDRLARHCIMLESAVNEELAATAVWGTQQLEFEPAAKRFEGVFGVWYGTQTGVNRSIDVFKHANMAGTAALGGVVAVVEDDTAAQGTTAQGSVPLFEACVMPVFLPATAQEVLDLGVHAFAMSRYAGVWVAMSTPQDLAVAPLRVDVDPDRVRIRLPRDVEMPDGGVHIRWPDERLAQEARLIDDKVRAVLAYVRANRLNRNVIEGPDGGRGDRLGVIAGGKAFNDVRQALTDLGLNDATCRELGIRLHKVAVVWPLAPCLARQFGAGLRRILVVEEGTPLLERQLKEALYGSRDALWPDVHGTSDEPWTGRDHEAPDRVARAIARRLIGLGVPPHIEARLRQHIDAVEGRTCRVHRRSREGAVAPPAAWHAGGGTDRPPLCVAPAGGEGVPWVGQAPFSVRSHASAQLDGAAYRHSGLLAIRQAIAAKVDITYSILCADEGAGIGAQPASRDVSVAALIHELLAEGVARIVVVSDTPARCRAALRARPPASGITVHHRDRREAVWRELCQWPGCTVLVEAQARMRCDAPAAGTPGLPVVHGDVAAPASRHRAAAWCVALAASASGWVGRVLRSVRTEATAQRCADR